MKLVFSTQCGYQSQQLQFGSENLVTYPMTGKKSLKHLQFLIHFQKKDLFRTIKHVKSVENCRRLLVFWEVTSHLSPFSDVFQLNDPGHVFCRILICLRYRFLSSSSYRSVIAGSVLCKSRANLSPTFYLCAFQMCHVLQYSAHRLILHQIR